MAKDGIQKRPFLRGRQGADGFVICGVEDKGILLGSHKFSPFESRTFAREYYITSFGNPLMKYFRFLAALQTVKELR
jgi:hypothetical protein